jgi:hypothetical protein
MSTNAPVANSNNSPTLATLTLAPPQERIGELHEILIAQVPAALEAFRGKPLARFQWKSRAASGSTGQLEVSLHQVRARAGVAQFSLEFECVPKSGAPISVVMNLAPIRTKNISIYYRVEVSGVLRHWTCATDSEEGLTVPNEFSRPSGLAALEHLAAVWFAPQQDAAKHGVTAGVERVGNPILNSLLASFWPRFNIAAKKREWSLARSPGLSTDNAISINAEEWSACVLVFCLWAMLLRTLAELEEPSSFDHIVKDARGLPSSDSYWPRRSVDLAVDEVQSALSKEGLAIPWHVIEAACAALNTGKHVIFTGPPGCGKSKLAGVLASLATGREPLMVTASPAWSSGELIGRYFPRRDGNGLEFRPGFFLRAIDEGNRWLVIDEFNRANIDDCFGELFSVLADDVVELPFDEELSAKAAAADSIPVGTVRILPARRSNRASDVSATSANTVDYAMGPGFRLIGTMNDADRASLHQLSFALLRRFHIIRVEAPRAAAVETVITNTAKQATESLMLESTGYRLCRTGRRSVILRLDKVMPMLKELFARDLTKRRTRTYLDLVQERVVGLATVQDVIRFVAEGIRGSSQGKDVNQVQTDHLEGDVELDDHAEGTCASFLALGIQLSVFPQLDALTPERRIAAVRHILEVFQPKGEKPILMRRVEAAGAAPDAGLKLALVEHTDPTAYDLDQDKYVSIAEFLIEELCQQYRDTAEAEAFLQLLREATAPGAPA